MQSTTTNAELRLWKSGCAANDESMPFPDLLRRASTPVHTAEFWKESPIFQVYGYAGQTLRPKRKVRTGLSVMPWQKKQVDRKRKR